MTLEVHPGGVHLGRTLKKGKLETETVDSLSLTQQNCCEGNEGGLLSYSHVEIFCFQLILHFFGDDARIRADPHASVKKVQDT